MKKRNIFDAILSLNKMSTWCRRIASVHEKKKPFKWNTCDVMHLKEVWINTFYLFTKEFKCNFFRASFVQKTSLHKHWRSIKYLKFGQKHHLLHMYIKRISHLEIKTCAKMKIKHRYTYLCVSDHSTHFPKEKAQFL